MGSSVAEFSRADAIISIDEQQRIVVYNQGAESIFGWSRDEVLGGPLDLLLPAGFRELHREHVRAFAAGDPRARQMGGTRPALFGLRKDGRELPLRAFVQIVAA